MAQPFRLAIRPLIDMARPVVDLSVLRNFSVTATSLADKQPPKAPPKPASKAATTPPPPASSKGDTYESPEYYSYNEMSYYDMESDMRKSRLPQPKPGQPC